MTGDGPERIAALIERIGRLLSTDAHAGGLLPVQWEALRYRANRFSRTPAALTAYLGLTRVRCHRPCTSSRPRAW